jgi:hypothetical protein
MARVGVEFSGLVLVGVAREGLHSRICRRPGRPSASRGGRAWAIVAPLGGTVDVGLAELAALWGEAWGVQTVTAGALPRAATAARRPRRPLGWARTYHVIAEVAGQQAVNRAYLERHGLVELVERLDREGVGVRQGPQAEGGDDE